MRGWMVAAALVVASGCISCARGPDVTARGIGPATPATGGLGGFQLSITITDGPGGPPLPGAGVVVYWGSDTAPQGSPWIQVGPDRVVVEPGQPFTSTPSDSTLRLRTDKTGTVVAKTPSHRFIGIVAAAPGYTEEFTPRMASGEGADSLALPLYRSQIDLNLTGIWSPGGASSGMVTKGGYLWDALEAPFGNESARAGYAHRVANLDLRLNWTNQPLAFGDLAIGVGPSNANPTWFSQAGPHATMGTQEERASLGLEAVRAHGLLDTNQIFVGPASGDAYVAPFGLPFHLVVVATFDRSATDLARCLGGPTTNDSHFGVSTPAPGPMAALAVVGLLAMAQRTRKDP
ncbi:MAG: hypothetical protein ACYDBQ_04055 [Thermoplasmatota archaeon]